MNWRIIIPTAFVALSACSFFRDVEPTLRSDSGTASGDVAAGEVGGDAGVSDGMTIDITGDVLAGNAEPGTTVRWTFELTEPQVITITWLASGGRADIFAPVDGLPKAGIPGLEEPDTKRFFLPERGEYSFDYQSTGGRYEFRIDFDDFSPVVTIAYESPFKSFASGTERGLSQHDISIPAGETFIAKLGWLEQAGLEPGANNPTPSIVAFAPASGDYWVSSESADDELVHDLIIPSKPSNRYLWLAIRMGGAWQLTWE